MYARPAIIAPPNMAGILANLRTICGMTRANEAFRTITALCSELYPIGHIRRRAVRTAASDLRRPPAAELVR